MEGDLTIEGDRRIIITGDANGDDLDFYGELASTSNGITDVDRSQKGEDLLSDNSRIFRHVADFGSEQLTLNGLTLTGCQTSGQGGAVVSTSGQVMITNSTIAGNVAELGGGGIYAETISPSNATIADNRIDGGGSGGGGFNMTIANSTITGNGVTGSGAFGGGVSAGQNLTVTNSIVLGNFSDDGDGNELSFGSSSGSSELRFTGSNIVGDDAEAFDIAGADISESSTQAVQNASAGVVFAPPIRATNGVYSGILADNGGGILTVALEPYALNPALDAAGVGATATDARGEAAFYLSNVDNGGVRDLGAFELRQTVETPSLIVTTTEESLDGSDFEISLREAVAYANSREGADTITFAEGVELEGPIRLAGIGIYVRDELTIDGGGVITITGDANGDDLGADGTAAANSDGITDVAQSLDGQDLLVDNSRIFKATADLTLNGLTLTGGGPLRMAILC